jgi:hypothetical protein
VGSLISTFLMAYSSSLYPFSSRHSLGTVDHTDVGHLLACQRPILHHQSIILIHRHLM